MSCARDGKSRVCMFENLVMYIRQFCDVYAISCDVCLIFHNAYSITLWNRSGCAVG